VTHPRTIEGDSRGRITALLRRGVRTVDGLARAVGLTPNAVRQHLATLERDGVVVRRASRREGGPQPRGKPATIYEVAPEAEASFSRAYAPVLTALLTALPDHVAQPALGNLLRATGERLAAGAPVAQGDLQARAAAGVALLESLGGIVELSGEGSAFVIRGCSCPLSRAVTARPELCAAIEILLATVTGAHVEEHCDHQNGTRCRFDLTAPVGPVVTGPAGRHPETRGIDLP
jgi:predicted ArsR family transcriptional regulator